MKFNTDCLHAGYCPGNGEPRNIPIIQSTTFRYETSEAMGQLFDLETSGYFYTRLQNPTSDRGGRQARAPWRGARRPCCCPPGRRRTFFAVFNICLLLGITWWRRPPSTAAPITSSPSP